MSMMPALYVPKTRYTMDTNILVPVVVTFIRVGAIAMLEWLSLRFVDSAPFVVCLATGFFAVAVLAVLQCQDWLQFKGRWYFPGALICLLIGWVAISAFGWWKYPPQDKIIPTFPTAEEIATAIARNLSGVATTSPPLSPAAQQPAPPRPPRRVSHQAHGGPLVAREVRQPRAEDIQLSAEQPRPPLAGADP